MTKTEKCLSPSELISHCLQKKKSLAFSWFWEEPISLFSESGFCKINPGTKPSIELIPWQSQGGSGHQRVLNICHGRFRTGRAEGAGQMGSWRCPKNKGWSPSFPNFQRNFKHAYLVTLPSCQKNPGAGKMHVSPCIPPYSSLSHLHGLPCGWLNIILSHIFLVLLSGGSNTIRCMPVLCKLH